MRFGMMAAAGMLMAATAGMAHGERENRGLSPIINYSIIQPPMVIAAAADKVKEKIIGVCEPAENVNTFSFGVPAQYYLIKYEGKHAMDVDISRVQIKLLEIVRQPAHGRHLMDETDPYASGAYHPDKGYFGKDRIEAIVSVGKDVVRVVYNFVVQPEAVDQLSDAKVKALCPRGLYWKISSSFTTPTLDNAALQG